MKIKMIMKNMPIALLRKRRGKIYGMEILVKT